MFGVVLTLVVCSVVLHSSEAETSTTAVPKTYQHCGPALPRFLRDTCGGVFYGPPPGKRSSFVKKDNSYIDGSSMLEDWVMNIIGMEEPQTDYPFRSRAKAFAVIPEYFRRQARGVYDECCAKPCTKDEVSGYCG